MGILKKRDKKPRKRFNTPKLLVTLNGIIGEYNNPILPAKEQSELLAMALRQKGFAPVLAAGWVWVPLPTLRPDGFNSDALARDPTFGAWKLRDHYWVEVQDIIIDIRLKRAFGTDHGSIPHGAFLNSTFRLYRYQKNSDIRFVVSEERMKKLRSCSDLVFLKKEEDGV